MKLYLDFHNHTILINLSNEKQLAKLKDEFHFFVRDEVPQVDMTVDLYQSTPPEIPALVAVKILEESTVYRLGTRQYIDYNGQALIIWDGSEKNVEIYSENEEKLADLALKTIHSLLGEGLDKEGFCRIEALGISHDDQNAIVMLSSKSERSTLLTHLLKNPEVKIISEDMPLADYQGKIHSFPTTSHEKIDKDPSSNKNLMIASFKLSQGQSLMTEVSKWKMVKPILEHLVLGVRLPVIFELFLRFNLVDFVKLPYHFLMRSYCAFKLLRKSKCYHFYMGADQAYNAQLILELLYE